MAKIYKELCWRIDYRETFPILDGGEGAQYS